MSEFVTRLLLWREDLNTFRYVYVQSTVCNIYQTPSRICYNQVWDPTYVEALESVHTKSLLQKKSSYDELLNQFDIPLEAL